MEIGLTNKNVVVMASSQGLGKAIALEFAKEGTNVFLTSRNEASLQETAEEIKQLSGNDQIYYQTCDMSSADDIEKLFQEVNQNLGSVDILINNTGGPKAGGFEEVTDEDWYACIRKELAQLYPDNPGCDPAYEEQSFRANHQYLLLFHQRSD